MTISAPAATARSKQRVDVVVRDVQPALAGVLAPAVVAALGLGAEHDDAAAEAVELGVGDDALVVRRGRRFSSKPNASPSQSIAARASW